MRYSNKQLLTEIQNGNEEVLVYLAGKYFQQARRTLRIKGVKDSSTPGIFSAVLIRVWLSMQNHKFPSSVEFETYFFNSLEDFLREEKTRKRENRMQSVDIFSGQQKEVVAQCVSILDENARNLVFAYYAEHLNFEQIAARFQFSNAVIAQYEVSKAMSQLEGIVKLRLNISLN